MKGALQKTKIREIWGNTPLSREIEEVFQVHDLDLFKLMECCQKKGQDITVAVAAILSVIRDCDVVVQCDCGEVMGFSEDVYKKLKKLYDDRKVRCKRCDPLHVEKLRKVAALLGHKGPIARFEWRKKI